MNGLKIIHAWKDAMYRSTLSEMERETLPDDPAGGIELGDEELGEMKGGVPAPVESWFITSCQMVTACRCD